MRHVPLLLLVCSCAPKDPVENDSGPPAEDTGPVDADQDGLNANIDCDDLDPAVGGPATWYEDVDRDGYGDPATLVVACDPPADAVEDGTDCDDRNASTHPGADEVCGSGDQDCDALVDEDDPDLRDALSCYDDLDGDGYGGETLVSRACSCPEGTAADRTDCDDTLPAVHPDADEICEDGLDNDCDGPDEACRLLLSADVDEGPIYLDGAERLVELGDLLGDGVTDLGVLGDGGAWVVSAVPSGTTYVEDLPWSYRDSTVDVSLLAGSPEGLLVGDEGAVYVYTPTPGVWSASDALATWTSTDRLSGLALASLYGDETPEIISASTTAGEGGLVCVDTDPTRGGGLCGSFQVIGASGDALGYSFVVGQVDGDGVPDLLVGAPGYDGRGRVLLFLGPISGLVAATDADTTLNPQDRSLALGSSVAIADLDGDGSGDLFATDPDGGMSSSSITSGLVHVFLWPARGEVTVGDSPVGDDDLTVTAASARDHLGSGLSVADLDGDGSADLLVGAESAREGDGAVYLLYGPLRGDWSVSDASVEVWGTPLYSVGYDPLLADLSGDGVRDVLVGTSRSFFGFLGTDGL